MASEDDAEYTDSASQDAQGSSQKQKVPTVPHDFRQLDGSKVTASNIIRHSELTYPSGQKAKDWLHYEQGRRPRIPLYQIMEAAMAIKKSHKRHVALPFYFTRSGYVRPEVYTEILLAKNPSGEIYLSGEWEGPTKNIFNDQQQLDTCRGKLGLPPSKPTQPDKEEKKDKDQAKKATRKRKASNDRTARAETDRFIAHSSAPATPSDSLSLTQDFPVRTLRYREHEIRSPYFPSPQDVAHQELQTALGEEKQKCQRLQTELQEAKKLLAMFQIVCTEEQLEDVTKLKEMNHKYGFDAMMETSNKRPRQEQY